MKPILELPDNRADLDRRFAEYLTDKTVAIVGRGNLHILKQGAYIDSHDVVVRLHRIVPYTDEHEDDGQWSKFNIDEAYIPKKWQPYIGAKTNIHYHRYGHKRPLMQRHIASFRKAGGMFYCFEDPGKPNLKYGDLHDYHEVRYTNTLHMFQICEDLGARALPGTLIICDILRQPIKRAYITGFPCYFDDVKFPPDKGNLPNLQYLQKLCRNPRVTCDALMRDTFQQHCAL